MDIKFGTCSWNYDSWVGDIYPQKEKTAAEYLKHYCKTFRTAEIDSWFYRIPDPAEVLSYLDQVDDQFSFTCKVTSSITRTHLRGKSFAANPDFLSNKLFDNYLKAIDPMLGRIDGIMFEFEYLNKGKMAGVGAFIPRMERFLGAAPKNLPLAIEIRNKNYLTEPYFDLLNRFNVMHVFSEKEYMPPVYEVFNRFKTMLGDRTIIRLLGGNRKEIEALTNGQWNNIVLPKPDIARITSMIEGMVSQGIRITINVNNHYEGSAPKSIGRIQKGLGV